MRIIAAVVGTIVALITLAPHAHADPKSDVEKLMNEILPFGRQMLEKYGTFSPYGAAMDQEGETILLASQPESDTWTRRDVLTMLKAGCQQEIRKGRYKATAILYIVLVTPPDSDVKVDAIAAALDHQDDYSVIVYFPYTITEGGVEIGDIFSVIGKDQIFGPVSAESTQGSTR